MTKKTWIKIGIVIIITCVICFSDWSFAAEWDEFKILNWGLDIIVCALSWLWILFAKLAGIFLTNNWVYGETLWLDALMWKFWNVVKNIANFWLWFYFVYKVFEKIIKREIEKDFKNILLRLLIAWVGIQASWFLVAAIIDISTVTLTAVGSFPAQVISNSQYMEKTYKQNLYDYLNPIGDGNYKVESWKTYTLFPKEYSVPFVKEETVKLNSVVSVEQLVEAFLPKGDDVSWPLYYIWLTILETNVITSMGKDWSKAAIFNTIIQWWTTIIFAIEMLVLCVVALIRIIYLWMFIVLSPIAILLWCIEKSWQKFLGSDSFFMKQLSFTSFFINVFKPTIIVLWFWVAVLFTSLMKDVVRDSWNRPIDIKWATVTSVSKWVPPNGNPWDERYIVKVDNNLISFTLASVWKTFLEIIISILTVLIVYFILKFAVKFGKWKDFMSESIWKFQGAVGDVMTSLPIMPVSWYDEKWQPKKHYMNIGQVFGVWKDSIVSKRLGVYQWKLDEKREDELKEIRRWFDDDRGSLKQTDLEDIRRAISSNNKRWLIGLTEAKKKIENLRTTSWKWMSLGKNASNEGEWRKIFTEWLNQTTKVASTGFVSNSVMQRMINKWKEMKEKGTLEELFGNKDYAKAYAEFFLGEDERVTQAATLWRTYLKDLDISQSSEGATDENSEEEQTEQQTQQQGDDQSQQNP